MNFEIEYRLEVFRSFQNEMFDEDGKVLNTTYVGRVLPELMLELINMMENELKSK